MHKGQSIHPSANNTYTNVHTNVTNLTRASTGLGVLSTLIRTEQRLRIHWRGRALQCYTSTEEDSAHEQNLASHKQLICHEPHALSDPQAQTLSSPNRHKVSQHRHRRATKQPQQTEPKGPHQSIVSLPRPASRSTFPSHTRPLPAAATKIGQSYLCTRSPRALATAQHKELATKQPSPLRKLPIIQHLCSPIFGP